MGVYWRKYGNVNGPLHQVSKLHIFISIFARGVNMLELVCSKFHSKRSIFHHFRGQNLKIKFILGELGLVGIYFGSVGIYFGSVGMGGVRWG